MPTAHSSPTSYPSGALSHPSRIAVMVKSPGFFHVWAAFNFAFLRCSEFTYSRVRKFRPLFDLTTDCIAFHASLACRQVMSVQLKSSKTDIFRQGQSLTIASTSSILCAVTAMQEYFLLAKLKPGPLFYFQSGRYLNHSTVSHLVWIVRGLLQVSPIGALTL